MKDKALALAADAGNPTQKLNLLREYLQVVILRSLHESEAWHGLVFVGGTALRLLYGLPRFSEDLDFSVIDHAMYEPTRWLNKLKRDLNFAGFSCKILWNEKKTVNISWVRIGGLLFEAGLSTRTEQNLSIKLEIDTHPPEGGETLQKVVTRHETFVVRHHDKASLMAGKVHALVTRPYTKGRDWYDLLWYRSQRPPVEPNLELLQNALRQTTEDTQMHPTSDWKSLVKNRLNSIVAEEILRDVRPFLERPKDAEFLTRENLLSLV